MAHIAASTCHVCKSDKTEIVYTAPLMPFGAQLIDPADMFKPELFYPLHYMVCRECSTFQSLETIPSDLLPSENKYISATSKTVLKRDREVFEEIQSAYSFDSGHFVVEIGGSDGIFLQNFFTDGIRCLNIEPVDEAAVMAREKGIETTEDFLTDTVATRVIQDHGKADLIIAKHVLEIVPDLHDFVGLSVSMLSDTGRIMMEVPYIIDLMKGNFYDILAHLRKYHFSLTSLVELFGAHGCAIDNIVHYDSLGGGLRFYAGKKSDTTESPRVLAMLSAEKSSGITDPAWYSSILERGLTLRKDLFDIVHDEKTSGKRIIGYGAGIKASAVLNSCGIDGRYIDYLVDNGRHKQGKLMPGIRVPIHSPDMIDDSVDDIILLAWLHQDEIVASLDSFLEKGGKIIVPTPEVSIIER